jgi:hypothetical protein
MRDLRQIELSDKKYEKSSKQYDAMRPVFEAKKKERTINSLGSLDVTSLNLKLKDLSLNEEMWSRLSQMKNLKTLLVPFDTTDADLLHLRQLSQLEGLSFRQCKQINGEGLIHLSTLKKLRWLDFSYSSISDDGLLYLPELHNLKTLNLFCSKIGDRGVSSLHIEHLESLYLGCTQVTDLGIRESYCQMLCSE